MPKVRFTTDDGVVIIGEHAAGGDGGPAALFLHMMPATKESWRPLAAALAGRGFTTLAIDLRGHGESIAGPGGKRLAYKDFSDTDHQATLKDVAAAVAWLDAKGIPRARLALVGASIGANLSIAYAGSHEDVPAAVALSPGLEYHGVVTETGASAMPRSQKLLLAASREDAYSFDSVKALAKAKADAEVHELDGAGHGTAMLERMPGFLEFVTEWIVSNVR